MGRALNQFYSYFVKKSFAHPPKRWLTVFYELKVYPRKTMNAPKLLLLPLLLLLVGQLPAQLTPEGVWDGFMTVGGIYSDERLPMQLYLTAKDGNTYEGRSYVQLPDGSTLRMDLEGRIFKDQSIELIEVAFAGDAFNDVMPEFNRQYQIIFQADLWDPKMYGYWQEQTAETFGEKRRRGKMTLTRRKVKGA